MLYPNGQNKKYIKNNINFKNRGMNLENMLNSSNKYYYDNNIAIINKRPTPIKLVDVDYKNNEVKKGFFAEKSTLDYEGIYKGKYITFDAKESKLKTSFPLANIKVHQMEYIKKVLCHGAIAFLIIYIDDKCFLLPGTTLIDFTKNNARKSIPLPFLEENAYIIKEKINPRLDYIEIVDKIYL